MKETAQPEARYVIGPVGSRVTLDGLPSPDTKRWVCRRKAEIVAAVLGGLLSLEEACSIYGLSFDEFRSWQKSLNRYGLAGLKTTRIQLHRNSIAGRSVFGLNSPQWIGR
jgi:hypothetical protein